MRKLIFILSLALCSLFVNAQQLEPNYHYSFWSNWNIGAGAVYSKPFDVQNWWFNNGANFGVDVRLEKPLSNAWTLRLDARIPGIKNTGKYDRYGTAMAGANLNLGKYFYLFADGGASLGRFGSVKDYKFYLAADAGLGSKIYLTDDVKLFVEAGADCASIINKETAHPFAIVGVMYNIGLTEQDRTGLSVYKYNQTLKTEYDNLVAEKEVCNRELESTIAEIERMRNCCNTNNEKYEKEIAELKNALEKNKGGNSTVPFSILFEKDSFTLSKDAKEIVKQVAVEINRDGGNYTLYGFGDSTGSEEHNLQLSTLRCNIVKEALIKNGVDENKVKVVGLGKTQYYGSPESYINRRVMFVKD